MTMTPEASEYFERNAAQWDTLRASYFTEAVREAAIHKADLRPELIVADVGAGTGFMTAGIAALVQKVYVLDGSQRMLDEARKNLSSFDNLIFEKADGLALPLPDGEFDVVFANMYLHHCADPLAAISEMSRILRPGGRLVITDMDDHPYEWLKTEMADVWQGFERPQILDWYQEAGLVDCMVEDTGQSCRAESSNVQISNPDQRYVQISTFVATGIKTAIQVLRAGE